MSGERTFGIWTRIDAATTHTSALELRFARRDLCSDSSGCGRVADFLAQFLALGLDDPAPAVNALSTMLNELIQNAAKFSAEGEGPIEILLRRRQGSVVMEVSNVSGKHAVKPLALAMVALGRDDPEELFRRRVMGTQPGGLGLILLRKDYGAVIGARVSRGRRGLYAIRVRARMELDTRNASRSSPTA